MNIKLIKNSAILYLRMFVILILSLFISRLILKNLGVLDYGIYGVVGSVVTLFSFLNQALITSGQRFFSIELEQKKLGIKNLFNILFTLTFLVSIFILTILLIFGNSILTKLNIPQNRLDSAKIVYYLSSISFFFLTLRIPFTSLIVSLERFKLYSYLNVLDVFLKFLSVFFLFYLKGDTLINYSILLLISNILILIIYFFTTRKEVLIGILFNQKILKDVVGFFSWNLFGGLASISLLQGLQILLNLFFNPIVNASQAISIQLKGIIETVSNSIQTAANPSLIRLSSADDKLEAYNLLKLTIILSSISILLISIPLIIETEFLLKLWLKNIPNYTILFVKLMLINVMIDVVTTPIVSIIQSIGNIKIYQILVSFIILIILPISYLLYYLGFEVHVFGYLIIISTFLITIIRIYFLYKLFKIKDFKLIKSVVMQILIIPLILFLILNYLLQFIYSEYFKLLILIFLNTLLVFILSFYLVLKSNERQNIFKFVKNKILRL